MEFWSIEQPTRTLTYTLTISAPVVPDDWLIHIEHDLPSPKDEKEQLETFCQVTTIVEKDSTTVTKSPWDIILNYTAPKVVASSAATCSTLSFETWSKRAQGKRARKSNGKAQNGKGGAGSAGAKAGSAAATGGGSGDPVVVGGSGGGCGCGSDLSTQRGEGEGGGRVVGGGGGGARMSELYRILQPVANGLTSVVNQTTVTVSCSSSSAAPHSAESAILASAAAIGSTKSANKANAAIAQSLFPFTGSSTPATMTWNGSISPSGSEKVTAKPESDRSTTCTPPQPTVSVSLNGPLLDSHPLTTTTTTTTTTTQPHQPMLLSKSQPVSSKSQANTMKEDLQVPFSSVSSQLLTPSKPEASLPVLSTPQAMSSKSEIMNNAMAKESTPLPLAQQSILLSQPPQVTAITTRGEDSLPQQSLLKVLSSSLNKGCSLSQMVGNGSTALPAATMGINLPLTTTATTITSALSSTPIAAASHINRSEINCSENPLPTPEASRIATTGCSSSSSESQLATPHNTSTSSSTTISTSISTDQTNAGSNQVSQAVCNTASSLPTSGAPLIMSTTGNTAGASGVPTKIPSSQASCTSGADEKIPNMSHVRVSQVAKSNGALPEAFLEQKIVNPAVFSRFISPQVHVVKGDAVSATLMFANDDSVIAGGGRASYEVDIVRVQNDKPTVVAKETNSMTKMEVEEAGNSEEKSTEGKALLERKENEISVNSMESMETETVNKGEGQMGGVNVGQEIKEDVTNSSKESKGVNELENGDKRTDGESLSLNSTANGNTPPTTGSSMTTPTSTSPKPTTPTSMTSFVSTNSSIAAFPLTVPIPKGKSPPTSGHRSPPTSPMITVFQNMAYVPYISNNHLYLYPVSPHSLVGHAPSSSQQTPAHMQFMTTPPGLNVSQSLCQQQELLPHNQKSANKSKTPRRRRKQQPKSSSTPQQQSHPLVATPASQASPGSPLRSSVKGQRSPSPVKGQKNSEDAVAKSLCLQRKGEGLPMNPFTLTYTVTSSAGHSWSTNSLEGEQSISRSFSKGGGGRSIKCLLYGVL